MLHTHLHINTTLIRRTSGRNLGTFTQGNVLISGENWAEGYFHVTSSEGTGFS